MSKRHVVKQGECLTQIAQQYGYPDHRPLHDHPSNSELKRSRPNPNILYPGDQVSIPEPRKREEIRPTTQRHKFQVRSPRKVLRVRLLDANGDALANQDVEVVPGGILKKTDGNGLIDVPLPTGAQRVELRVADRKLALELGHLNPFERTSDEGASGAQGRLRNLGYYAGPVTDRFDKPTRLAIWLFQTDMELPADGRLTRETMAKLIEEHGC